MCIDGTQKVWTFRESIKCQLLSLIFLIFKAKRKARTIFFPFQLLKYLVRINITHRQLHRFYLALSRIAKRLTDPLEHTLACSSTNLGKKMWVVIHFIVLKISLTNSIITQLLPFQYHFFFINWTSHLASNRYFQFSAHCIQRFPYPSIPL